MIRFLLAAASLAMALAGIILQLAVFRRMEGEVLRQTMVTIGISIVVGDAMLWIWGGGFYQIETPGWLAGAIQLPLVVAVKSSGEVVYLGCPFVRIAILIASIVLGVAMWLVLNRSRVGMLVRAGVDDRQMLAATGVRVQLLFVSVFAFGAGLAGIGDALEAFLAVPRFAGFLRGASVVAISDGLEIGEPDALKRAVSRMSRLAWRLDWLTPLAADKAFEPQTKALKAILPSLTGLGDGSRMQTVCAHILDMARPINPTNSRARALVRYGGNRNGFRNSPA